MAKQIVKKQMLHIMSNSILAVNEVYGSPGHQCHHAHLQNTDWAMILY